MLLPEIAGERLSLETRELRTAIRNIAFDVDAVVLLSPHGRLSGVYSSPEGSLDELGPRGISAKARAADDLAEELAAHWRRPLIEAPADFGVVVPLLLLDCAHVPVVAAALADTTGPDGISLSEALEDAAALASSLQALARTRYVAFVSSAQTSAALSERAPLAYRGAAEQVEEAVLGAIEQDVRRLVDLAPELHEKGGACGAAALAALGGFLPPKTRLYLHAYSRAFGVGYVVATTQRPEAPAKRAAA